MTLPPPDPRLISGYKDDTLGQQEDYVAGSPEHILKISEGIAKVREEMGMYEIRAVALREARLLHLGFWVLLGIGGALIVELVGLSLEVPISLFAAGGLLTLALLWIAVTGLARTWSDMEAYARG